jgi:uncharacterized protein YqhQ
MAAQKFDVGGQAVIEGVMMRSPRSFAVVCRRPSGEIVIKEDVWRPIWGKLRFLRWPLLRGTVVLDDEAPPARSLGARAAPAKEPGRLATFLMLAISIGFGLALFVGAPHLAAWGLGTALGFDAASFWFHLVDGVIKVIILVGYLAAISLLPDIKRVFQYHGAEHKAIFTYEKGLPLTIDNARAQTRFHPRCGTSFLLIVVMISVVIFAATLRGGSRAFKRLLVRESGGGFGGGAVEAGAAEDGRGGVGRGRGRLRARGLRAQHEGRYRPFPRRARSDLIKE